MTPESPGKALRENVAWDRERIQAAASELQELQIAERTKIYEAKLKASQERQRRLIDAIDAERRQRVRVLVLVPLQFPWIQSF